MVRLNVKTHTWRMLYDLLGIVVVVVIVVDIFGFLHERRYGARRVFDDVRLELVQFRESL